MLLKIILRVSKAQPEAKNQGDSGLNQVKGMGKVAFALTALVTQAI